MFDRTFGGLEGTAGSGAGRDVLGAIDPLGDEFELIVRYRNLVRIGALARAGDLFETPDVTLGNVSPQSETASLFLDTDLVRGLEVVPEPWTSTLIGTGLAGVLRRRPPRPPPRALILAGDQHGCAKGRRSSGSPALRVARGGA